MGGREQGIISGFMVYKIIAFFTNQLVTIYFPNSQIAASFIVKMIYICIQWERRNGICLLHLDLIQNYLHFFFSPQILSISLLHNISLFAYVLYSFYFLLFLTFFVFNLSLIVSFSVVVSVPFGSVPLTTYIFLYFVF